MREGFDEARNEAREKRIPGGRGRGGGRTIKPSTAAKQENDGDGRWW